ncbi:hypothetical protein B0J11DRAFT_140485 [Dendryphion nanum]|uniref:DUF7730 domain-containing protein n=1 Tax=Dendryphion nanum TaxID=256645 RepID=A0A9P9D6Z6_9PLEO|nr:hypothetical protein B0J11DRAFT_140485 [Dendryphion nanum]
METPLGVHPIDWIASAKEDDRISFLDLPREIRDEVYGYAFKVSGAIFILQTEVSQIRPVVIAKIVRDKGEGPVEPKSVSAAINIRFLRVCRQVHAEGSKMLYSQNTYRLYSMFLDLAPSYHLLVRQISFTTDATVQKLFDSDLETVGYWWRRHFWPDVMYKSNRTLETFGKLDSLRFILKSNRHGQTWRPPFFGSRRNTKDQRVTSAAFWLKSKCPVENERLRKCLHLEIAPTGGIPKDMFKGSKFEMEDDWDCAELSEAFELMKKL